jgi:hypothetical protein
VGRKWALSTRNPGVAGELLRSFRFVLKLQITEPPVNAVVIVKLVVRSAFNNPALIHDMDLVSVANR